MRHVKRKAPILRGLLKPIWEIPLDSVQPISDIPVTKTNFQTLTSYNLRYKRKSHIIVPGAPRVWKPSPVPFHVPPDAGRFITDPNQFNFPGSPMAPLVEAILSTRPNLRWRDVDFISDRKNLRLLMGFVTGKKDLFRIHVEVVKTTVIFTTWSSRKTYFVRGFGGYGHEFENVRTAEARHTHGSLIHNRIVQYGLGGYSIILRFEVDACLSVDADYDSTMGAVTQTANGATLISAGTLVQDSQIVEIKTGPAGKSLDKTDTLSQMWFSETPILCTGHYRDDGIFKSTKQRNIGARGKLVGWEKRHQDGLRKLVRILELIAQFGKQGIRKFALVHDGSGILRVFQEHDPEKRGLSEHHLALWDNVPAVESS
ncbi:hypothetical protein BO71DRAFT_403919 [Aspergillus ellipticus CBS 707.79]|uniref:Geranylgeranyl pyrophosphate synthetase n=1 Tax=Aspergillus ellipticus CBS 707.79 TaxID=1448320 RepID=A0A319D1H9_9EURO|nr:hypothetical protein BO71DRAFT_403919 [Aspergillus ellipticus CBS 707.79]